MKALNVLSVAFPLAPVGPDAVGGAEQILGQIDEALVAAGHRSYVIACEGSAPQGVLIPIPRAGGRLDEAERCRAHQDTREMIERALRELPIDLVHMHGIDFMSYLPDSTVPLLATLHLPPSWYPDEVFCLERPATYLQCVSTSQLNSCPPGFQCIGVIENGVPLERLQPLDRSFGYAIALGRICPEKGFHLAAAAARKSNMPLLIGGAVFEYDAHVRYFREEVEPLLDKRTCKYIGPVGARYKRLLLAGAQCLVVPSLVSETSSLVAMESLACGTPVVAFKAGALTEIVEHGRTGFLVTDVDEMAEAMKAAAGLDRKECRAAAVERFSAERMCTQYLDLFQKILGLRVLES